MTMTAASAAMSVRYVSSEKSWWPGVSRMLTQQPSCSNCSTEEVTEMPRSFSMSIQSETACFELAFPLTEPAVWMLPEYSSSFSVSVVLPASGCEMIANVRRDAMCSASVGMGFLSAKRPMTRLVTRCRPMWFERN